MKGDYRYYKITPTGVHRITISSKVQPPPGYKRGLGPINNAHCSEISRNLHKDIPKSGPQRERMRQAKLGVPKSEEHRAAMSAAHLARSKELYAIMAEHNVKWGVACEILKERRTK